MSDSKNFPQITVTVRFAWISFSQINLALAAKQHELPDTFFVSTDLGPLQDLVT